MGKKYKKKGRLVTFFGENTYFNLENHVLVFYFCRQRGEFRAKKLENEVKFSTLEEKNVAKIENFDCDNSIFRLHYYIFKKNPIFFDFLPLNA